MPRAIETIANVAAILGILLCAVSGAFRLTGSPYVGGYEAMTLFNVGVGLMMFAVLAKLEALTRR